MLVNYKSFFLGGGGGGGRGRGGERQTEWGSVGRQTEVCAPGAKNPRYASEYIN